MSLKVYELVVCITGAVGAVAAGLITYLQPPMAGAIVSAIEIATTAISSICALFIVKEQKLLKK